MKQQSFCFSCLSLTNLQILSTFFYPYLSSSSSHLLFSIALGLEFSSFQFLILFYFFFLFLSDSCVVYYALYVQHNSLNEFHNFVICIIYYCSKILNDFASCCLSCIFIFIFSSFSPIHLIELLSWLIRKLFCSSIEYNVSSISY